MIDTDRTFGEDPFDEADYQETDMQTDSYYRGYRLSSNEGETHIFFEGELLETVTLQTKGRFRTTSDAAMDIVDGWLNAR